MLDQRLASLHRRLARLNRRRLRPGSPDEPFDPVEEARVHIEEEKWLRAERAAFAEVAAEVPRDADELLDWFEMLEHDGPGQNDPFFDYLARSASLEDLRWFLRQEASAEVPLDEVAALVSRGLPPRARIALARSRWDDLGAGQVDQMAGPLFARLDEVFQIFEDDEEAALWEAMAVANTTFGFAHNRRWALHALGALGAIELTVTSRAEPIAAGLRRLGLPLHAARYYARRLDAAPERWDRFAREVLPVVVEAHPDAAPWIAEGALARLEAGRRAVGRYRGVLCAVAAA